MNLQLADIIVILICGAACTYCYVLGRRLSALQNTKNGLGATIASFSKSVSEISSTTRHAASEATQLANRLANLIEDAHQARLELEEASSHLDEEFNAQVTKLKSMHSEMQSQLAATQKRSRDKYLEIETLLQTPSATNGFAEGGQHVGELAQQMRARMVKLRAIVDDDLS